MVIQRQTAYLVSAADVLDGEYVRRDGWEPNFVASSLGMLSRVRLSGVIVEQSSALSYILDDGSARVSLRFFDPSSPPRIKVGSPVMIIGRPRESNNERYVVVEILRSVSTDWVKQFARDREDLKKFIPAVPEIAVQEEAEVVEEFVDETPQEPVQSSVENKAQILIDIIRRLDPGDGAPTAEVIAQANFPEVEEKLNFLISEGEIFELRAGKIKVLE